jgi:hypothetical protein
VEILLLKIQKETSFNTSGISSEQLKNIITSSTTLDVSQSLYRQYKYYIPTRGNRNKTTNRSSLRGNK